MSRLKRLLGRADSPRPDRNRASREMRAVHDAIRGLMSRLDSAQLLAERMAALRADEQHARALVDGLEHVLVEPRVANHVRDAVSRTALIAVPAPHALIAGLLPVDTYDAAVGAIPMRIFFERRAAALELPLPPAVAPTHVIVTWTFLANVVKHVLTPALVDLFETPLERHVSTLCPQLTGLNAAGLRLTASRGRLLVQRSDGRQAASDLGPWDWLSIMMCFSPRGERMPGLLEANSALVAFVPSAAPREPLLPAPAGVEWCVLQYRIGPDKAARRVLLERMNEPMRRRFHPQHP